MRHDEPDCASCRHFDDDPASIEAALPGLTILSSASGSVRGRAGLCAVLDRFMEPLPARGCPHFAARRGRRGDQIADQ